MTALGDEEIGWFDVAVNYAFGMRCVEGVGNLDSQIQNLLGFHGPSLDAMLEGLALKQFHRYEGLAFFFTDVVNCADVGMIEGWGGLSFASKTGQSLRVPRYFIGQKLERNKTVQANVFGPANDTHPAATKLLENPVVRDGCPIMGGKSYVDELGKSMKTEELESSSRIVGDKTLIDPKKGEQTAQSCDNA